MTPSALRFTWGGESKEDGAGGFTARPEITHISCAHISLARTSHMIADCKGGRGIRSSWGSRREKTGERPRPATEVKMTLTFIDGIP